MLYCWATREAQYWFYTGHKIIISNWHWITVQTRKLSLSFKIDYFTIIFVNYLSHDHRIFNMIHAFRPWYQPIFKYLFLFLVAILILVTANSSNSSSEEKVFVAQLCLTLCDPLDFVADQAPLSMGFSRQEYWIG